MKAAIAELIGTFLLVFIGAGAGTLASPDSAGLVAVALAHGWALVIIVYVFGAISGAHVNPAVTLGIALTGRINAMKAVVYWIAQFAGGLAAAYLLAWLIGTGSGLGETVGKLTPNVPDVSGPLASQTKVIVLEAVLTFFLMLSVMACGVLNKCGNAAGIAIGMVLTFDILMGGSLTGASMNPARTFGPAFVMRHLDYFWMYLIGPFLGAGIGALLYDHLFATSD